MKTILFAFIFLSACATVPSLTVQKAAERTPEPLVAKFEPSIPPPPSAHEGDGRAPSAAIRIVKPLSDGEILNLWVQVNNRKDSLIRSNPAHYWAWMNRNLPEEYKAIADFQGQVVADPHYFNFADVHGKNKSGLALVDVDDSGVGSLYLDFVRFAVFVKAYMKMDLTKELLDAYKDGLEKKEKKLPDYLKPAVSKSRKDLLEEHAQWVQKNLKKNYKLDSKSLKIKGLKDAKDVASSGEKLAKLLETSGKAKKVYDIGYSINDSGSSRGMDRFWFSMLTDKNISSIYECKQLAEPAVAYYTRQKNAKERISDVMKVYSDVDTDDSYVFPTPNTSYWCRPKHFDFFNRDIIETNRDKRAPMTEYSRYLAYWIGLKHGSQAEGPQLLEAMKSFEKKELHDKTVDLILQYEEEVFKLGDK